MTTDIMISANGLTKRFGSVLALNNVSFEVNRGEVVGFLGPNGAGKSTTMRILTCFLSPSAGTAQIHGRDLFDDPLGVRQVIGYLPQRAPLYGDMSVIEYLKFTAEIRGLDPSTFSRRLSKVVEVCGLGQTLHKQIFHLSHGYRQRVGLGQALIHDPPILVLDEPTSDLDPNEKAEVLKYIKEIGKNRTILLSTHNLSEVEDTCARAIIVSKGRLVADGPLDQIRATSGSIRYLVAVDERSGEAGRSAPKAEELESALRALKGVTAVREMPTDENEHRFELSTAEERDIRAELYRLMVDKGWTLLELRRDVQSLDAVFRELTRRDERLDRGYGSAAEDDELEDDQTSEEESSDEADSDAAADEEATDSKEKE